MKVDGSCHCGAIEYTADVDPSKVFACHCTDCQVLTGSPYRVVVPAPAESFSLRGEPTFYVKVTDNGARRVQAFCAKCGTPIYSGSPEASKHLMLRVGALNQRATLVPSAQIWKRSAMPWVESLHSVPSCQEQELLSQ